MLSLCCGPTSAANTRRAFERYFKFKLSFTFLCSFAASDLVWLAHRHPQGLNSVAYSLPLLKVRVGRLPQFRWKWLGKAAVLCVLFWTENVQNSPRAFSKAEINMLQRDQTLRNILQVSKWTVCSLLFNGTSGKKNLKVHLVVSNGSQNKTHTQSWTMIFRLDCSWTKHLSLQHISACTGMQGKVVISGGLSNNARADISAYILMFKCVYILVCMSYVYSMCIY